MILLEIPSRFLRCLGNGDEGDELQSVLVVAEQARHLLTLLEIAHDCMVRGLHVADLELSAADKGLEGGRPFEPSGGEVHADPGAIRSEEHTSELPSLIRISYAVFCLNK